MTSRVTTLAIDAVDPVSLADFWCAVLGWRVIETETDIVSIGDSRGSGMTIDVIRVPEHKTVKNRLHLDLTADGDAAAELQRLYDLGAEPVDIGQGDVTWTVLADPEGNEFCLLSSRRPGDG
jgi:predicted enzyme related to lactoylglutathione lyase